MFHLARWNVNWKMENKKVDCLCDLIQIGWNYKISVFYMFLILDKLSFAGGGIVCAVLPPAYRGIDQSGRLSGSFPENVGSNPAPAILSNRINKIIRMCKIWLKFQRKMQKLWIKNTEFHTDLMESVIQIAALITERLIICVQASKIWKLIMLFVQKDTKSKRKVVRYHRCKKEK